MHCIADLRSYQLHNYETIWDERGAAKRRGFPKLACNHRYPCVHTAKGTKHAVNVF